MKKLIFFLAIAGIFSTACTKKAHIALPELNGIWAKQNSFSKQDRIAISNDTVCTWYNYQNTLRTKTFTLRYSVDKSRVALYEDDCKRAQFDIRKDKKGRYLFNVQEYTFTDGDGNLQTQSGTYIKQ